MRISLKSFISFFSIPVKREEVFQFMMTTALMFSILAIQNLIRAQKDSIINTMVGTEMISFLKFWGVLPASMLMSVVYIKLLDVMRSEYIFYMILSIFLVFFIIFAYYIFPSYQDFHLSKDKTEIYIASYPNLKWFILLLSNWSFSLFYIIAELWPNVVYSMLFWQFVNRITNIEQSKRFYPIFGLIGQTGLILCGIFLESLKNFHQKFQNYFSVTVNQDVFSIQLVVMVVAILGVCALLCFWILNSSLSKTAKLKDFRYQKKSSKQSIAQSFKIIISSRYIMLITLLLLCYGIAINLVEAPWKKIASSEYATQVIDFQAFVGGYLKYTGMLTIPFVLICSNVVRKVGWIWAAMITPSILFITGIMFFISNNFDTTYVFGLFGFIVSDPVVVVVFLGAIQNALSKSAKYTFFDATKEMSYVPLDDDLKTKGKAAADIIGTKLGKSMSAFLQSLIFILVPTATYSSISMYLMVVFIFICVVWFYALIKLHKIYKEKAGRYII